MDELAKIRRVVTKVAPTRTVEVLLVLMARRDRTDLPKRVALTHRRVLMASSSRSSIAAHAVAWRWRCDVS